MNYFFRNICGFRLLFGLFTLLQLTAITVPFRAEAKALLADLNFAEGNWTLVGVSVYNYHPLPVQEEWGSFKLTDINVLREMQKKWVFKTFYEDNCEYHYVLKFYKGKTLTKTLKVNLHCNYISEDVFSYEFNPELLTEIRSAYQKISWKNYRFTDLKSVREKIKAVEADTAAFFYHDIRPYLYDGFFIASSPEFDWKVNRDSVITEAKRKIAGRTGEGAFHLVAYLFYVDDKWKLSYRYVVYCNENVARKYKSADVTADWRGHFAFNEGGDREIELMVVGR